MQAGSELKICLSLQAAGIIEHTRSGDPLQFKALCNRGGRKGEEKGEMRGRHGFSTQ